MENSLIVRDPGTSCPWLRFGYGPRIPLGRRAPQRLNWKNETCPSTTVIPPNLPSHRDPLNSKN